MTTAGTVGTDVVYQQRGVPSFFWTLGSFLVKLAPELAFKTRVRDNQGNLASGSHLIRSEERMQAIAGGNVGEQDGACGGAHP